MTLDEAIKHAEEVAEEQDILFKRYDEASRHHRTYNEVWESTYAKKALECFECAKEHRLLAEWLKELKAFREQARWIPVSERLPEDNENVLMTIRRMDGRHNDYPFVSVGYIGWNQQSWWCAHDGDCAENHVEVLAWMPLPEPYKAESEE